MHRRGGLWTGCVQVAGMFVDAGDVFWRKRQSPPESGTLSSQQCVQKHHDPGIVPDFTQTRQSPSFGALQRGVYGP